MALTYGTPGTLTWGMTNPSSDTNLLIGRQSTSVTNSSDLYDDIIIGGAFTGPSSGAAAGVILIFAYGSWDGGTTFTSDCTGTDGALTLLASTKQLLMPVAAIITNTNNSDVYNWGPVSLLRVFGGVAIPEDWGLWGTHDAGGALTGSTTKYTGITR